MLPVANTAGMIEHLSLISQATAKDRQALVIVDRAGWHMTKAMPIQNILIYTKFKKQLNQKTPLSTTQIFNKTILT
jgi:hypothetical protein